MRSIRSIRYPVNTWSIHGQPEFLAVNQAWPHGSSSGSGRFTGDTHSEEHSIRAAAHIFSFCISSSKKVVQVKFILKQLYSSTPAPFIPAQNPSLLLCVKVNLSQSKRETYCNWETTKLLRSSNACGKVPFQLSVGKREATHVSA